MANEITTATLALATDQVSDAIGPALANKVVCLPHVFAENLPVGTIIKQARKDDAMGLGTLTAQAATYSIGAAGEVNQTKVQLTVAKTVIGSKLTDEAEQFGQMQLGTVADKQANALARTLDNNVKALASGFSQDLGSAAAGFDIELAMDGLALIEAGNAGATGSRYVCFVGDGEAGAIRKQVFQSGASAFTNLELLSLISTFETPNGYIGSLGMIDFYRVAGLPTGGGARSNLIINPELAFFGMYAPAPKTWIIPKGVEGVYYEVVSFIYSQVAEWYDEAGIELLATQ
jgi:hypothetical protein